MKPLSIAWKDLLVLLQDRGSLVMTFLLPLGFILAFSGVLGGIGKTGTDTRLSLPVVNLDGGAGAVDFLNGINQAGGVRPEVHEPGRAQALLSEKKVEFVLTLPAGFSDGLTANRPVGVRLTTHPDASAERVEAVRLVVEGVARAMGVQSQILASLQMMGDMMANAPPEYQAVFTVERAQAQARAQFQSSQSQPLVTVKQSIPASGDTGPAEPAAFGSSVAVPGFAVLFVFLTAQATARSIYDEKKTGTFRRLLAAPMSRAALLAGKVLPNLIVCLVQVALMFAFGIWGLRLLGQEPLSLGPRPWAVGLVLVVLALCSSALGILIAAIARTESQIGGFSTLLLWVMGVLGGSLIPVFLMEKFMGPLMKVVPHTYANRALNNLMLRGAGLADVSMDLLTLLGFAAAFFAIGIWRFDYD